MPLKKFVRLLRLRSLGYTDRHRLVPGDHYMRPVKAYLHPDGVTEVYQWFYRTDVINLIDDIEYGINNNYIFSSRRINNES